MSDLPDPRQWYAQIVMALRDQVFSKNLRECLTVLELRFRDGAQLSPDLRRAAGECLKLIVRMPSDADLRFWIHERAAVPEAIAAFLAVDLAIAKARHPMTDTSDFALFVRALQQEVSLRSVMRAGLELMLSTQP